MVLCQAHAQYTSLHAYDPFNLGGGLTTVRNWDEDHIVSFYVTPSYTPMIEILELSTTTVYYVPLPDTVFIKDMVVDANNDMLYFCGSTSYHTYEAGSYNGVGLLGWIDLNSVMAGYINMEYYRIVNSGYTVDGVNKLVEYDDGGYSHIVAIGEENYHWGSYSYSQHYFIDCMMNVPASSALVDVRPFSQYERYRDVLLTDKYVVFMGYDANPATNSICYRKTNPYNVHDVIFDDIHVFYNGNDAMSVTHSTAMQKDDIATAYFSINGNGDFVTRLRVIDVANDVNTNAQEFIIAEKGEPDDIVYISKDSSLVLKQYFYTNSSSSYNSNFVLIEPYTFVSYTTDVEFIIGESFDDLSLRGSNQYLAGAGASWFFKDKTVPASMLNNPRCPSYEKMYIKYIDRLVEYSYPLQITPNINLETSIQYRRRINSNAWRPYCFN